MVGLERGSWLVSVVVVQDIPVDGPPASEKMGPTDHVLRDNELVVFAWVCTEENRGVVSEPSV